MRIKPLVAVVIVLLSAEAAQAGGFFDLMFNKDTIDVWGGLRFGKDEDAGFLLGGRYLDTDEDDIDGSLPGILAGFQGRPSANEDIEFLLGAQYYFGDVSDEDEDLSDEDVAGVGIGGNVRWSPAKWKGAYFGGRFFFVPDMLASGETEVIEWAVEGGYRINPKIRAFLDYTSISADLENGDEVDLVDTAMVGIGFQF